MSILGVIRNEKSNYFKKNKKQPKVILMNTKNYKLLRNLLPIGENELLEDYANMGIFVDDEFGDGFKYVEDYRINFIDSINNLAKIAKQIVDSFEIVENDVKKVLNTKEGYIVSDNSVDIRKYKLVSKLFDSLHIN